MYRFYGWQEAKVTDSDGRTPCDYYDMLLNSWDADTCAPRMREEWSAENPTRGQCSITAFVIQDHFGGTVWGIPLGDGNYHCFNRVDGVEFDITSEQFGDQKLDYEHASEQLRAVHFAKAEKHERYRLLRERLLRQLNLNDPCSCGATL